MDTLKSSILKSTLGLSIFAVLTTGVIATTQIVTKERIDEAVRKAQTKALLEIVPATIFNNDLLSDVVILPQPNELHLEEGATANLAREDGRVTAIILPAIAMNGYSGPISIISAVDIHGSLLGVRVIEHKETPGLGDKAEARKSDWIQGFNGKSLSTPANDRWKVKKDGGEFDQMTGATITPRAIVGAVKDTLVYFKNHKAALSGSSTNPHGSTPNG
ncbi:MAG: electron transport complex subunit RsxG [Hahellaceae bacterium]|nr:electron transport complex subunit RsxG [Hahellaceae bacterium]